jgi:Putative bacterial sensory transduction regulator
MVKWLIGAAAAVSAFTATAQAQMVTAQNPQSVVSALQNAGYKAELTTDGAGDPKIESGSSGNKFVVFFYGCTKNRDCTTLQFYAGWSGPKVSLEQINKWNNDKRFSRALLDKDGDPVIKQDLDLDDGGLSRLLFEDNLEYWVLVMNEFAKYIGV